MSLCDVPGISAVCHAATEGATNAVSGILAFVADALSDASSTLFTGFWSVFEATTFVDITTGRFTQVYDLVFGIAVFVMIGFFLLQLIGAMIRREPAALTRAALGLAKSILGSFVILTLLASALEITDRLCLGIIDATGTTVEQMGDRFDLLTGTVAVGAVGGPAGALLLTLFLGALAVAAGFVVWLSLLVRKALLLVAIVFAPVALAGATWDATRGWVTRWGQVVLALIVSKLVMVVFFLLAAQQVAAPIDDGLTSLADPLAGIVLLLVAGFAPYLTYKAISFMGVDFYHAMSTEQEAKQALNRPVPVPGNPMRRTPPRVLSSTTDGAPPPPALTASHTGAAPAAGSGTSTGAAAAHGSASTGATGGAAAAGAGVAAAGAVIAQKAASAGPALGRAAASQVGQQAEGTDLRSAR